MERFSQVTGDFELGTGQIDALLLTATSLDGRKLDALAEDGFVPREAIEALIEETHSEWLQVSPILKMPPVVEKVK